MENNKKWSFGNYFNNYQKLKTQNWEIQLQEKWEFPKENKNPIDNVITQLPN